MQLRRRLMSTPSWTGATTLKSCRASTASPCSKCSIAASNICSILALHEFQENVLNSVDRLTGAADGSPSPVEGAALEMPYTRKGVVGSNPTPSAIFVFETGLVAVHLANRESPVASTVSDNASAEICGPPEPDVFRGPRRSWRRSH